MTLVLKCLICHEEIEYSKHNPSELIEHMKTVHPKVNNNQSYKDKIDKAVEVSLGENKKALYKLVNKSIQTEIAMNNLTEISACKCDDSSNTKNAETSDENGEVTEIFVNKQNEKASTTLGKHQKRNGLKFEADKDRDPEKERLLPPKKPTKFYRTSIEHWKPIGDAKIHCPRCLSHKRPVIRTQKQYVTSSSIASSFFMACWPLCSSPCFIPEPKFENLHCPICNFHLGIFDHQRKTVTSNPRLKD